MPTRAKLLQQYFLGATFSYDLTLNAFQSAGALVRQVWENMRTESSAENMERDIESSDEREERDDGDIEATTWTVHRGVVGAIPPLTPPHCDMCHV